MKIVIDNKEKMLKVEKTLPWQVDHTAATQRNLQKQNNIYLWGRVDPKKIIKWNNWNCFFVEASQIWEENALLKCWNNWKFSALKEMRENKAFSNLLRFFFVNNKRLIGYWFQIIKVWCFPGISAISCNKQIKINSYNHVSGNLWL